MRFILKFIVFVVVALVPKSWGMDHWQKVLLDKENGYRADHRTPAMQYSEELASNAQKYANHLAEKCLTLEELSHSPASARMYKGVGTGENIYRTYERSLDETPRGVEDWYGEIVDYPWGTDFDGTGRPIHVGHFTQQIWKATREVGYGVGMREGCDGMYLVAHYYPPGNNHKTKHYNANVLPPRKGAHKPERHRSQDILHMLGRYY